MASNEYFVHYKKKCSAKHKAFLLHIQFLLILQKLKLHILFPIETPTPLNISHRFMTTNYALKYSKIKQLILLFSHKKKSLPSPKTMFVVAIIHFTRTNFIFNSKWITLSCMHREMNKHIIQAFYYTPHRLHTSRTRRSVEIKNFFPKSLSLEVG